MDNRNNVTCSASNINAYLENNREWMLQNLFPSQPAKTVDLPALQC